jgi:hypothetical protein
MAVEDDGEQGMYDMGAAEPEPAQVQLRWELLPGSGLYWLVHLGGKLARSRR